MEAAETTFTASTATSASTETTHHNMQSGVQKSKLLSIPPEVRNNIYSVVLSSPSDIVIPESGRLTPPPLLSVCKLIQQEATQLYYAVNTFRAIVRDDVRSAPLIWTESIGRKSCRYVKGLTLEYKSSAPATEDGTTLRQLFEDQLETTVSLRNSNADAQSFDNASRNWTRAVTRHWARWLAIGMRLMHQGVRPSALHFVAPEAEQTSDDVKVQLDVEAASAWRISWEHERLQQLWLSSAEETRDRLIRNLESWESSDRLPADEREL
ncbi:hypothetical protein LTR85_007245 [Meristemomyces frigidus]|nr:hypothetical protein LTR85_007245 [Meristemomyces frigidus]